MPEKERDYRNREITWSEIDKRKDRSSHVSEDPRPFGKNKEKADWLRKMALKEANKHFQGKQGTPAHDKAVDTLQTNLGGKKFQGLAKQYLDEYDLPKHWGTQFLFLDYEDPEVVLELMQDHGSLLSGTVPAGTTGLYEQAPHAKNPGRGRRSAGPG